MKRLLIYLITNVGKEFSYNSLKKYLEIPAIQTVIDYISYFEDSYLVFTLPKFNYSYKKQLIGHKKIYSIDNGFSNANSISFSKDKGRMLENVVFLHLRKKYNELFFFREEKECDFVVKEKDQITRAIQVCYHLTEDNQEREINGLLEAMDKFNLKQGVILTYNQEDELYKSDKRKIQVIPVWKWMLDS